MDSLGPFLSSASVLVALFASAGYGFQRNRVTSNRERAEDAEARVAALKEERLEDQQKISDLQAVVRIATGEVKTQAILDLLEQHHGDSLRAADRTERASERTEDLLGQIIDILVKRPKP